METLRELFLSLGLDADEASFASATAAVDLLEKGLDLAAEAAMRLGQALVDSVFGAANYGDAVADAALKTSVGVEQLQELEFAAVQSGTSFDGVVQALVFLNRNLYEASTAGGEAAATFAQLGIKVKDATGKVREPGEVFSDLAAAIAKVPPGADRSALAMKVLGRSGADLVPLLSGGSEGLEAFAEQARRSGSVIGPEDIARAQSFADQWDAVSLMLRKVSYEIGNMLLEDLGPMLDEFRQWFEANREIIRQKLKGFIDGVRIAVRLLTDGLRVVMKWLDLFVASMRLAAIAVGSYFVASAIIAAGSLTQLLVNLALNTAAAVAYGAAMVVAGLEAAAAWVAATWPVLVLTAALLLAVVAAQDVWGALHGQDSLIGDLGPKWTSFLDAFTREPSANPILLALQTLVFYLSDLEGRLLPMLKESWASSLLQPLSAAIELLFSLFRGTATFADYLKTIPGLGLFIESVQSNAAKAAPLFDGSVSVSDLWGGGAAGPEATAASSTSAAGPKVLAPQMRSNIVIQTQPGQSAQEVAGAVRESMESWFQAELAKTSGSTDGS